MKQGNDTLINRNRRMLRKPRQDLVICEPDIEAALDHLRALPYRPQLPVSWDRKHLLNLLRETIGDKAKQAEHAGEIRWNDLFEVREKIIALEKEQVNLSGEGAKKLQKFMEQ